MDVGRTVPRFAAASVRGLYLGCMPPVSNVSGSRTDFPSCLAAIPHNKKQNNPLTSFSGVVYWIQDKSTKEKSHDHDHRSE